MIIVFIKGISMVATMMMTRQNPFPTVDPVGKSGPLGVARKSADGTRALLWIGRGA